MRKGLPRAPRVRLSGRDQPEPIGENAAVLLQISTHGGIAKLFKDIKKYAVSRSGEVDTSWAGSVLLRDIADVKRLKQEDGPNLVTQGSTELVHALLANDLAGSPGFGPAWVASRAPAIARFQVWRSACTMGPPMQRADLATRAADAPPFSGVVRTLLDWYGGLFAPSAAVEEITTRVQLPAPPERVWSSLKFYEEVPSRPGALLRIGLPAPVRSEGDKLRVGGTVRCVYEGGYVLKRTTSTEPPSLLRFEVLEQRLGLERCLSLSDGVYEIRAIPAGSEVALTTRYRGHLRPRVIFRPLERRLTHEIHGHILAGMRLALEEMAEPSVEAEVG